MRDEMRRQEETKAKIDYERPTHVQKLRGNIQYLSHFSIENEHELEKTYARNRQTRKEVNKKYGF
jgi:hypothetical protein